MRRNIEYLDAFIREISARSVAEAIRGATSLKAPGGHNILNFWYKRCSDFYELLVKQINQILNHPNN